MTKKINKILIITSGGDAPGMNAVIRAVVRSAIAQKVEVYGIDYGYCGLLTETMKKLEHASVANIIQRGGTMLKTARCLPFHNQDYRDQCRQVLADRGIDGIVVLGGNGSFRGADFLTSEGGPPTIGIPCTIDNDIPGTHYCIGFDTACNTAVNAIDKIRDTAFSLDRNFMIEVMGRASGILAVEVGIAGGAEMIFIPEIPFDLDEVAERIKRPRKKTASIIVVAEADKAGHTFELAQKLEEKSGIKYTVCILGHIQRGGSPTVIDRKMGTLMGIKAVEALLKGESRKMIAHDQEGLKLVSFPQSEQTTRFFSDQELLTMNQLICDIY